MANKKEVDTKPKVIGEISDEKPLTVGSATLITEPVETKTEPKPKMEKLLYDILSFKDPNLLKAAVNSALNDGWKLAGGLTVSVIASQYETTVLYNQAITR